jgi:hypothetical protein
VLFAASSATAFADAGFKNLAATATISASSELEAPKFAAANVADGLIAPQGSGVLEVLPDDKPAKSWAVNGETAKGQGELLFTWKEPVTVDQVVYFGRTPWLVQECFKDYEVYLNAGDQPAVKGTFEMKHGPQRVRFTKSAVTKLRIKFLNSHGGPNPGAAEVLVLGDEVSDEALAALAPNSPPIVKPKDELAEQRVVWNSPSKNAADAMPLGNGLLLANTWIEPSGDLLIALAQIEAEKNRAAKVGRLRIKLDPPLNVADGAMRQTLMFTNGAVEIVGAKDDARPIFSIWVDANRSTLHVQLRCRKPINVRATIEGADADGKRAAINRDRVVLRGGKMAGVLLGATMKARDGGMLQSEKAGLAFDLQLHTIRVESPDKLDDAIAAVAPADVIASVREHLTTWKQFWDQESFFVGGENGEAITQALTLRRFLSASSGHGPHQLRPAAERDAENQRAPEVGRWTDDQIRNALKRAGNDAKKFLAATDNSSRFPTFWGANFERMPGKNAVVDPIYPMLRGMLVRADSEAINLLPDWPNDRNVTFRVALPENVRVQCRYADEDFKSIEVWPKQRSGRVVGAGHFEKRVRRALPGYRVPALLSFLSPSWVAGRVGMDNMAAIMKKMNFNGYEGSISDIDWCSNNKIYLIVHGVNPWVAHRLKDERNVVSYFMADRNKPHAFPHFGNIRRQYEQIDPTHPTEFNTYAQWGGIEHFVDAVRPKLLEYYDYHWQRRADLHFHYLEYYRRMSIAAGRIPVFRFVHVHGDAPVKMRQTVSMSVAYGIKGFKWWVGWTMFDIHKVKENEPPPLSEIGKEVSRINTTLAAFSPHLAQAWSVDIFHTDPLPTSARKAPENAWVKPSGEHIVMGIFKNDENDGDYLVVANRDIGNSRAATITFREKVDAVRKLDKKTRKWVDLAIKTEDKPMVTVNVNHGDAELLQVVRHAGIDQK